MSRRRSIIVGSGGQDGRWLTAWLAERGDEVIGIRRDRIDGLPPGRGPAAVDVGSADEVEALVEEYPPDEVYYLAAHQRSSEEGFEESPAAEAEASYRVHVAGPLGFLEAMRCHAPGARLFYASSCLVFGADGGGVPRSEEAPVRPAGLYGMTKAMAGEAIRLYRERHGLFASVGILYNHESALRKPGFITRRLAEGALEVRDGKRDRIEVGDLEAVVDWADARDYVRAYGAILALEQPDDFVVASGRGRTVRELAEAITLHLGLDLARCLRERPDLVRRVGSGRVGDPSKLRRATGWEPRISFERMVADLVDGIARERCRSVEEGAP